MQPRRLSQLDAAIAEAAAQPLVADCLRAERAGLLARQGRQAEARAEISELHAQYAGQQPHPAISGWISLAEGLLSYYSDLSRSARDKLRRAHALAGAVGETKLQALAAAWLSHLDCVAHDFDAMARHAAQALQLAGCGHHGARARASLVVAQAYHFGGRCASAQPWYAKARQHATAEGDKAMFGAVMHNMAALLTSQSRQLVLCGVPDASVTRHAMLSAECSGNFNALVGMAPLGALVPLLRAQLASLQGRWDEAVALYDAHFQDGMQQGLDGMRAWLGADLAWCRWQLGQGEQALQDALAAAAALPNERDVDDRAAAHSRLAQVFGLLGQADAAARHRAQAALDWAAHQRNQAQAVALMEQALAGMQP